MTKIKSETVFVCDFEGCLKICYDKKQIERHKGSHLKIEDRPLKCEYEGCNKRFYRQDRLKEHIKAIHFDPIRAEFKCDVENCLEQFTCEYNLYLHKKNAHPDFDRYFYCSYCSQKFTKKWQIKEHEASHTNDNPFKCSKCSEEFKENISYKKHLKTHAKKFYMCNLCNEEFLNWTELIKHNKLVHPPEYKCDSCKSVFKSKSSLKKHQEVHSESRTILQCSYKGCPRFYYHQKNLNHHIRSSHEGKSKVCPLCSRQLSTKQKLDEHMKLHRPGYSLKKRKSKKKNIRDVIAKMFPTPGDIIMELEIK